MDLGTKKRKTDENGAAASPAKLAPEDAGKILSSFSRDQLLDIVNHAICNDDPAFSSVLPSVRSVADRDPAQRKLFIRGLGWETTTDSLRSLFSSFGDLEEAVVITDKATGKSKGYGFITFRHIDGAILALKEPSKKIDGRMTVTQLAAAGNTGSAAGPAGGPGAPAPADVMLRKIYVGNVPPEMSSDRLLALFSSFGEIEEGPLGFDKQTGKFRGYALFVYKNVESARAAIEEPTKTIDGHHMICKLANDGKKGKPGAGVQGLQVDNKPTDGQGLGFGGLSSQYGGGPGSGLSSFGGSAYSGGGGLPGSGLSSIGSGLSAVGSQVPSSLGGSGVGSYGGGFGGGPYGSGAASQYSGPGSGGYGGLGMGSGMGSMGSSLYRMPPSSVGMGSGSYAEGNPYSLSSLGHSNQHHQPTGGSPPGPRVPPGGGMYQGMPPYY